MSQMLAQILPWVVGVLGVIVAILLNRRDATRVEKLKDKIEDDQRDRAIEQQSDRKADDAEARRSDLGSADGDDAPALVRGDTVADWLKRPS